MSLKKTKVFSRIALVFLFFQPALFLPTITSCSQPRGDLVGLGDSLTQLSNYGYYVALQPDLELNGWANYGIYGSTVSNVGYKPFIYRYRNMYRFPKIVIIDGGYNDYALGCPIGTEQDKKVNTFYGALNILLPGIQSIYTNAWIFYMTPFYYADRAQDLKPYVDAIVNRCSYYNMDCFNIFNPDFPFDYTKDTYDGVHVTPEFTQSTWAPKISEFIRKNYSK